MFNLQLRYATKQDLSLVTVFMTLDVQFTIILLDIYTPELDRDLMSIFEQICF